MIGWYETKEFVAHATTVSMDALHVIAGTVLLLAFGLLFRKPVTDLRPLLAVLVVAVLNEAGDFWAERWPSLGMQLGEAAKDLAVTMLLPTVLLLTARRLPRLYAARKPKSPKRR
jgi:hypothetical protein